MPSSNPGWRRYRRWLPWSRPARASALAHERPQFAAIGNRHAADADIDRRRHRHHARQPFDAVARGHVAQHRIAGQRGKRFQFTAVAHAEMPGVDAKFDLARDSSEEHTYELQSLMRNP